MGTATVDRVLHGRGGVAEATVGRIRRAQETIQARGSLGNPTTMSGPRITFDVILPADAGPSTESLGAAFHTAAAEWQVGVSCAFVEKMNPVALAEKLLECRAKGSPGVAFQALDHPLVRDAVSELSGTGIPALALMSDLGGSDIFAYVGTDNRAAGRTAGVLMGRFTRAAGKVAILWGGQLYRSHEEREIGFRSVVRSEYLHLEILDLVYGRDDAEDNYKQISSVLDHHDDLVGIYSVGGGIRGVVRALAERERARDIVLIGHNLTEVSQRFLLDGSIDAIIHQDMEAASSMAVRALVNQRAGLEVAPERLPVEILVKENMQGRIRP